MFSWVSSHSRSKPELLGSSATVEQFAIATGWLLVTVVSVRYSPVIDISCCFNYVAPSWWKTW